jgi:hypothetical protein
MSHEPPIPEAARSPYPLQPPPIDAQDDADAALRNRDAAPEAGTQGEASDQSWTDRARDTFDRATESKVALGAAVGIGSAALLAALLFTRRGNGKRSGSATAGAIPASGKKTTQA